MLTIRAMHPEDRALFLQLAQEMYNSPAVLHPIPAEHHVRTFEALFTLDAYVTGFLLEWDGTCAGYSIITRGYSTEAGGLVLWVEDVYIRPAFRSKGIGRAFFAFLEKTYPNMFRFRLEVEEKNQRAIALYKTLGFESLPYMQMVKDQNPQPGKNLH